MNAKKIKVLVVDDSLLFREFIRRSLSTDPVIEVVALAGDPFEARDQILRFEPDVMTCDIEMPRMNGIEFLRRLLPQHAIPVVVVSTISEAVLDAMRAGAVDFVEKPNMGRVHDVEQFIRLLISKVKAAAQARVAHPAHALPGEQLNQAAVKPSDKLIVVGASTGGTEAIFQLLSSLPEQMPGFVIVQHIPAEFSRMYAARLNATTKFQVKEAESGDYVDKGKVLIAPGDKHVRLKKVGGRFRVECLPGERINGHCPSVDVLFESAAKEAGTQAIGIILTGMGYDGARGLLALRRKGARTIGQNEKSSVVYGMPKVAFELGAVEKQASLQDMPRMLLSML